MTADEANRRGEGNAPEQTHGADEGAQESANDGHIDPDILLGRTDTDTLLNQGDLSKDLGSGSTSVGQEYYGGANAPEAQGTDSPENADR
jgi:hypothetical protein